MLTEHNLRVGDYPLHGRIYHDKNQGRETKIGAEKGVRNNTELKM